MTKMTAAERLELGKLVRLTAKVAKDDAEARGQWMLSDAEAKLAAIYKREDEAWADITQAAEKCVAEADAAIAALCRERGIPEDFRLQLHCGWYGRGVNASKERRSELRKVAQAQVAARVAEAKVEIDRQAARQLTQITQAGLTAEEARAFIGSLPKPEDLLPPLGTLELHSGEVIALEAPVTLDRGRQYAFTGWRGQTNKDIETMATPCIRCGMASRRGQTKASDGEAIREEAARIAAPQALVDALGRSDRGAQRSGSWNTFCPVRSG
jgi:hypothetical protein